MDSLMDLVGQLKKCCQETELAFIARAKLSLAEFNGISALEPGERVCGNMLSRKMGLSPSRASRVIEKLVKNGFLVREIDPQDRRRCTICLAKKGVALKQQLKKIRRECEEKVRDQLSAQEIDHLIGHLRELNEALSASMPG